MNDVESFNWCVPRVQGGIWLDIGAHHGRYSQEMSKWADHVYAFEATLENVNIFKSNVTSNNVSITHAAVSNGNGTTNFFVHEAGPECECGTINLEKAIIARFGHTLERRITVPMLSIDKWVNDNNITDIRFIKIDVEGAEQWVLEGMRDLLMNNDILISMEQHQCIDCNAITNFLHSVGYIVTVDGVNEAPLTIQIPGWGYILHRRDSKWIY